MIVGGLDQFTGSGRQLDHEDSAMLRLDHHFSASDTAYLRFSFDAAYSDVPSDGLNDRQLTTSRPVNGELEELHIYSTRLVNELKFGFNRSTVFTSNQGLSNLPYSVAVSGLTTLANNEFTTGVGNSFSYIDNLTMVRGARTLKFGVEARRIQLDQGNTANGTVVYSSLNLPASSFQANSVSSATFNDSLPLNGLRKTEVYSYAQDEWKFRPNFTLNLGVRYTFYNIFHEVHGKADPFDFATCGAAGYCGVGASFGNPNTLDVDPRISFAWLPMASGGGKTVIRSGFGITTGLRSGTIAAPPVGAFCWNRVSISVRTYSTKPCICRFISSIRSRICRMMAIPAMFTPRSRARFRMNSSRSRSSSV